MLGLDAYGSSSDEEDAPIPVAATRDPPRVTPVATTAKTATTGGGGGGGVNFKELPRPSGGTAAKRVVRIPAPALANAALLDTDSDDDDWFGGNGATKTGASAAAREGTTSLASALPKPKRAALGGGALGGGGGGGAMLDLGNNARADIGSGAGFEPAAGDEEDEEDALAGPHAADAYAVDDEGQYVNQETYAYAADAYAVGDDGLTRADAEELDPGSSDFVDRALRAAAKEERERHGRDVEIVSISAEAVRSGPKSNTAPIVPVEGILQDVFSVQTSSTARQKHQITSLLHEAKVQESRILESGQKLTQTRAAAKRKYGW